MSLFRRKDVASLQAELETDHSLKRTLGAGGLVMLGIGAIIGAGIFVLTGQAAATYAGPAIVYSFLLAGTACAFAGLCYAEFAAMIPIAGSAYTYGYVDANFNTIPYASALGTDSQVPLQLRPYIASCLCPIGGLHHKVIVGGIAGLSKTILGALQRLSCILLVARNGEVIIDLGGVVSILIPHRAGWGPGCGSRFEAI
jgi:hypothetical protein